MQCSIIARKEINSLFSWQNYHQPDGGKPSVAAFVTIIAALSPQDIPFATLPQQGFSQGFGCRNFIWLNALYST